MYLHECEENQKIYFCRSHLNKNRMISGKLKFKQLIAFQLPYFTVVVSVVYMAQGLCKYIRGMVL
jgi:hypothetical protein